MYSQHLIVIYLQNMNATFARQYRDTTQVRWEAFTSHHVKFNPENMYQMFIRISIVL